MTLVYPLLCVAITSRFAALEAQLASLHIISNKRLLVAKMGVNVMYIADNCVVQGSHPAIHFFHEAVSREKYEW